MTILLLAALSGCAPIRPLGPPMPDLARDAVRFGPAPEGPGARDLLALDEEMVAFVRTRLEGVSGREARARRLMIELFRPGEYTIEYAADDSFSARETFHRRRGNCLSTTALLVALAREAGLRARFQDVSRAPTFRFDESLWIHEKHVNALIDIGSNQQLEVDFDRRSRESGSGRPIDDTVAVAQWYSNLGVTALREGNLAEAHARFRQSVASRPDLAYVWNNIGVLYRRAGFDGRAETMFLHALALDSEELRAMTNLVTLYRHSGREREAQPLEERLERLRRRDPYYLYRLASQALDAGDLKQSRAFLERAMSLKADEPAFDRLRETLDSPGGGTRSPDS